MIRDVFGIMKQETLTYDDIQTKKALDQAVEEMKRPFKNVADMWVGTFFREEVKDYDTILSNVTLARGRKSAAQDYQFFHWELEFPEVFFDEEGRYLDKVGFDAVIGNPPYVRQEMLSHLKEYMNQQYKVYHGIADLYVYFIEQGISLLKPNGIFGAIVSNKWMRANYGMPLRRWMKQRRIEEIIDFGDLPVFEAATTYPCILRISKGSPRTTFEATQVKTLSFSSLYDYMRGQCYPVNQITLDDNAGWSLAKERV